MKKNLVLVIAGLLGIAVGVALIYKQELERAAFALKLFSGEEQYQNFGRVAELFPVTTMAASANPRPFAKGEEALLPETFRYKGKTVDVETFLADTDTVALLVLHEGELVYERYLLSGGQNVNWLSMSVAKSFISAAIGIAVDEGLIDIQRPITDYVPSLASSAYDGVKIREVLQMSSGAAWNEDYSDPESDINRMGKVIAVGGSADEFVASLRREFEPGTVNRYNSADTQALGMLLSRATGRTNTDYLSEKLWQPLGMESDAYWIIDDYDVEMAFFGLNATARDYAKLGELYRLKGKWGDRQIVSSAWVAASTAPDAPPQQPGTHDNLPLGYGYQWWIPESDEGEFSAIGVYNQFIYVNPTYEMVVVKLSAYSDYATSHKEEAYREMESFEFFREIGRAIN